MPESPWVTSATPHDLLALTPLNLASGGDVSAMQDDNTLSRSKKSQMISDYNVEIAMQVVLDAKANTLAITTDKTAYDSAVTALTSFLAALTPSWSDVSQDTPLTTGGGIVLRAKWAAVNTARATLQNTITSTVATNAQAAAISASATTAMQKAAYTTDGVHIDGKNLAGGAITSASMANSNSTNLIPNPNSSMATPSGGWPNGFNPEASNVVFMGGTTTLAQAGYARQTICDSSGYGEVDPSPWIPCTQGDQFFAQCACVYGTAIRGALYMAMAFYDKNKTYIPGSQILSPSGTSGFYAAPSVVSVIGTAPALACSVLFYGVSVGGNAGDLNYFNNFYAAKVIVAGMLAANSVVAGSVAAGAVTANSLVVGSFDNLCPNPGSTAPTPDGGWPAGAMEAACVASDTPVGYPGSRKLTTTSTVGNEQSVPIAIVSAAAGDSFYAEAMVWCNVHIDVAVEVDYLDKTGAQIGSDGTGWDSAPSAALSYLKSINRGGEAPAGTAYARLTLYTITRAGAAGSYSAWFAAIYFRRKFGGEVVVDGSVTAQKLAAVLTITSTIKSPNYSPGAAGVAPTGFRLAAYAFTTTYKDGSTNSNCQFELGGDGNFGGYKVATVVDLTMNRTIVFSGSGTWVSPITGEIEVSGVGAGGAGAKSASGGGGGGGGSASRMRVSVVAGASYPYSVGTGGVGTTGAGGNGGNTTMFGITWGGGKGASGTTGGQGGSGAAAGASTTMTVGFIQGVSAPGAGGGSASTAGGSVANAYSGGPAGSTSGGGGACAISPGGYGSDGIAPDPAGQGAGGGGTVTGAHGWNGGNGYLSIKI